MIAFESLSPTLRAVFALWSLLLCLACIGCAALAALEKRLRYAAPAFFIFAPSYYMWQAIFDLSLSVRMGTPPSALSAPTALSWGLWLAVFVLLSAAAVLLLLTVIRNERSRVTPGAIKVFLDRFPCGVCCFSDSGRVLFSNVCMNKLSVALTGEPLLNGIRFKDAAAGGIFEVGGRMRRFTCSEFYIDGHRLQEMIASDVTAEYARTQALERDKAELSRMNRELKEYILGIDDAVRRQEILQAKVNIHDEMNRLMLSTTAADGGDAGELDRIFSLWERNTLLLCMEAEEAAETESGVEELANALRISVVWRDPLPDTLTAEQRSLFRAAAREAVVNAVKHAGAKEMRISFEETEQGLCCRFSNDGTLPEGEVRFSGGLANLSRLAEKQGARISAKADGRFVLTLIFQRNRPDG